MSLLERLRRWWAQRQLHHHRIPLPLWLRVIEASPLLARLDREQRHRLRELSSLFLAQKVIVGAQGYEPDAMARVLIAAQASLLILNLGLDWYRGWSEIIVYPEPFLAPHRERDEAGVVHEGGRGLSGEAWGRGPVILSWADIDPARRHQHRPGSNVVLHEFAHKLDFLDGFADGIPPLHRGNLREEWAQEFSRAYADLSHHFRRGGRGIDGYATSSPAEFFAVMSELFFEQPARLQQNYPAVYGELLRFYRQDPLTRHS